MKRIDNISSIDGRLLLHELFRKMRFERQRSSIATLFILWRVCTTNADINHYFNQDITLLHKLGLLRGTVIWLEEVVNKFYFSTINSFVYFGAAVLLVLMGINLFSNKVDESIFIYGLSFEATMLLFIFIIMLFSPNEDVANIKAEENEEYDLGQELLNEIGEISKDFAITSAQLDKISDHLLAVVDRQNELTSMLFKITQIFTDLTNPNPQMIETMQQSNEHLLKFNEQVSLFVNTANQLKYEEIHSAVKKELENYFANKIEKI